MSEASADPPASKIEVPVQSNLPLAIGAGLTAAIVGAAVWAIVTITTHYQIGWMAIGVGLLVGFAIGYANGGRWSRFLGAFFALLGCVAGNFLSLVAFAAAQEHIPFFQVFGSLD